MSCYAIYKPYGNDSLRSDMRLCRFANPEERSSVTHDPEFAPYWRTVGREVARRTFPKAFRTERHVQTLDYDSFEHTLENSDGNDMWYKSPEDSLDCWTGYPK